MEAPEVYLGLTGTVKVAMGEQSACEWKAVAKALTRQEDPSQWVNDLPANGRKVDYDGVESLEDASRNG